MYTTEKVPVLEERKYCAQIELRAYKWSRRVESTVIYSDTLCINKISQKHNTLIYSIIAI